ncbi:hypothetical protein PTKIN_Ptkin15bG0093500 [Pterospermum kingtungense]
MSLIATFINILNLLVLFKFQHFVCQDLPRKAFISLENCFMWCSFLVCCAYTSAARRLSSYVPKELEVYAHTPRSYTTVRTILGIVRISAALARLHFSETVGQSDVDEARRMMQMSKFSLYSDDHQKSGLDAVSDIYSILRDEAARANKIEASYAHVLNWISRKFWQYPKGSYGECHAVSPYKRFTNHLSNSDDLIHPVKQFQQLTSFGG